MTLLYEYETLVEEQFGKIVKKPLFEVSNPYKKTKPDPKLVEALKKREQNFNSLTLKLVGEDKYVAGWLKSNAK